MNFEPSHIRRMESDNLEKQEIKCCAWSSGKADF